MWLTFLENYIIGRIEANAGHPDQLGWIKQALNIIALIGSAKLEAYAVPRLESWIKSAAGNPLEHQIVELAVAAIVKNGGEIGKLVAEAEALAEPPAPVQTITGSIAEPVNIVFGANAFNPPVQEQVAVDPTPPPTDTPADVAPGEVTAPVDPPAEATDAEAAHDE